MTTEATNAAAPAAVASGETVRRTLSVKRPKIREDYKAADASFQADSFAELVNVRDGETVMIAGRLLPVGHHVVTVSKLSETYIAQFGLCAGKSKHRVSTTRWNHYTATRGIEPAPLGVTVGIYLPPVGKAEIDAVESLNRRLSDQREANKAALQTAYAAHARTLGKSPDKLTKDEKKAAAKAAGLSGQRGGKVAAAEVEIVTDTE